MGAPPRQNLAALFGRHPMAETVAALSDKSARLVCALHGNSPGLKHFSPKW